MLHRRERCIQNPMRVIRTRAISTTRERCVRRCELQKARRRGSGDSERRWRWLNESITTTRYDSNAREWPGRCHARDCLQPRGEKGCEAIGWSACPPRGSCGYLSPAKNVSHRRLGTVRQKDRLTLTSAGKSVTGLNLPYLSSRTR